jgi:hypothetical protein
MPQDQLSHPLSLTEVKGVLSKAPLKWERRTLSVRRRRIQGAVDNESRQIGSSAYRNVNKLYNYIQALFD